MQKKELKCVRFLRDRGLDAEEMVAPYLARKLNPYGSMNEFRIRDEHIERFGSAILSNDAIEAMRPYAPLLELGAGSGYWSYELREHGVDVIPTDPGIERFAYWGDKVSENRWPHSYIAIEKLTSVEAVKKYPDRNLLICWPSLGKSWAADALDIFTGPTVIYMGEGLGNATADDRFHNLLDEDFPDQISVPMPHFWGSYDRDLLICTRKENDVFKNKTRTT